MNDTVIRAEGLAKRFIIGHKVERDGLLREAMTRGARALVRRGVDFFKGRVSNTPGEVEEFWALRDLNFEIKRGELVSIIGHNGAGKSTLLKILSRITEPTRGRVEINGRVNSLLEVGTGFHPELSGRENIFLNGAILGMSRIEMRRRFDEIVEFSGVSKFIDTPVKRYSVGMYVRLAFAVAAHLEAEILVVDEVLSVGDAEFQARCINRMSEVAGSGRTVLFVSHNFAAVTALTRRSLVLEGGKLTFDGPVEAGLAHYTASLGKLGKVRHWGRGREATLISAQLLDADGRPTEQFVPGMPLRLEVEVETTGMPGMSLVVILRDQHNVPVGYFSSAAFGNVPLPTKAGRYRCVVSLDALFLAAGSYNIDLRTTSTTIVVDHRVDGAVQFFVNACNPGELGFDFRQDLGFGPLALRSSGPLQFELVSSAELPGLQSDARLG
ncbi:Wzt C-terminal domain-containing protein [Enhydrobacter aerosaccus]|uniref:Wzt C-terminal domain-containing protein n=1 Tax=Enhydrobacter aerosaccus TaxID=225324 RepID=A0A1T4TA36_9HYPH|nr:ABC transporter ATP-binding protein [Enhydrobacter aerosaccus]SKA37191.1 Wzt C-terminal domain-containing protein [Enhydrobacter aerosaccus]